MIHDFDMWTSRLVLINAIRGQQQWFSNALNSVYWTIAFTDLFLCLFARTFYCPPHSRRRILDFEPRLKGLDNSWDRLWKNAPLSSNNQKAPKTCPLTPSVAWLSVSFNFTQGSDIISIRYASAAKICNETITTHQINAEIEQSFLSSCNKTSTTTKKTLHKPNSCS